MTRRSTTRRGVTVRPVGLTSRDRRHRWHARAPTRLAIEDFGELLGDGGFAVRQLPCLQVEPQSPHHRRQVDARVVIEGGVLAGERGLNQRRRNVVQVDGRP